MNLILIGPPGAGKGTQAQNLVQNYSYIQISTGDLLRNEIKLNSEVGKKIINKMENGEFVDDDIVNSLILKNISNEKNKNKIVFDGYPRNISQAKKLNQIILNNNQTIGAIIYLDVSRDIIKKRILGRITCEKCNITLNEYLDVEQIQNHKCGREFLKKRKDDISDTILKRYDAFIKETNPLLKFYSDNPSFFKVDASAKIQQIKAKIEEIANV